MKRRVARYQEGTDMTQVVESGWRTDPVKRHVYRYWDGTWTDQVSDRGDVTVDPLLSGMPPLQTRLLVDHKDYATPPLCLVCGQPSGRGSILVEGVEKEVDWGLLGGVTRKTGVALPLCDRCEAIRALAEPPVPFHGTKEEKGEWKTARQSAEYKTVRASALVQRLSKNSISFTFANPEFAEAFRVLNGASETRTSSLELRGMRRYARVAQCPKTGQWVGFPKDLLEPTVSAWKCPRCGNDHPATWNMIDAVCPETKQTVSVNRSIKEWQCPACGKAHTSA
jgi:rubrerythrin